MKTKILTGTAAVLAVFLFALSAHAELYHYTDQSGITHYTNDPATIPEKYRPQSKSTHETPTEAPKNKPENAVQPHKGAAAKKGPAPENPGKALKKQRDQLIQKKEALSQRFEDLLQEKEKLAGRREELSKDSEIKAYNQEVQALNQKIKNYQQEEQALKAEIEAYNKKIQKAE